MYMQASGASELRKFSHFHSLKLLFLSIFYWYPRYFVGINDMLVGLHVPTELRKCIIGGQLSPPPPLATLVICAVLIQVQLIFMSATKCILCCSLLGNSSLLIKEKGAKDIKMQLYQEFLKLLPTVIFETGQLSSTPVDFFKKLEILLVHNNPNH